MVARAYEGGKALNRATTFGIDDVIDPADTRALDHGRAALPAAGPAADGKEASLDRRLVGAGGRSARQSHKLVVFARLRRRTLAPGRDDAGVAA